MTREDLSAALMSGTHKIAGVILSGGRSSRMGGGDKCLLEVDGQNLLTRAVERIEPQVDLLAINANGDPQRFSAFGLTVIPDTVPGFAGPLAGILAAMAWAENSGFSSVVTVAGDTPFFPKDLVSRLVQARSDVSKRIAVASSGQRRHPVFALWPAALRPSLEAHLRQPHVGRVDAFIMANPHVVVEFEIVGKSAFDPFFNINTPDDLVEAGRLARLDPS